MSWDVLVIASRAPPLPAAEMPNDWRGDSLGTTTEVRQKISACLPATDWSDSNWGIFDGNGFSFEFNVGKKEMTDGFMVHVRGGGDAVSSLLQLAGRFHWYLFDCSQGEWLHHCTEPEAGWIGFQAYRDRMLGNTNVAEIDLE